jgi:UDP-N-acetylmuramoyl-tripeptide--D-alanyl-D-alanine ligase
MIEMTINQLATIMGGTAHGSVSLLASAQFQFDSRSVQKGDVFLALKGDHADGHDYVDDAITRGAALSIVSKPVNGAYVMVDHVLEAVAALAAYVRKELKSLQVIGITGSQGKTTTKDMLNSILSNEGPTIAAVGSFNNDLGVPLTLLRCDSSTKFCIVEMGARHGGDIASLTRIAAPNVGAVLKVGNAHLGEFGSQEKIAATKGELIEGLKPGSVAILGTYDSFTPAMSAAVGVKRMTFGETHGCTVRAADIEFRGGYAHFDLVTPEGREPVELRVIGLHQVANALAAAAIAHALGVSTNNIAGALSTHESVSKWRMEIHEGCEMLLINDAYNANPESMEAALRTLILLTQERGGRSWAFLGTMHELGSKSPEMHSEIGALAAEIGIDHFVAISNRDYLSKIPSSQMTTHYFASVNDVAPLLTELEAGDVILVKASRAEHLEILASQIIDSWNNVEGERI